MGKRLAWLKFYPSDWQSDQALGVCSLGARGLWMEMLAIMHRAEPYGFLIINGQPVADAQLQTVARTQPDQVPVLLAELETAGVFSRNRNGVIFSRRMLKDEKKRKDGKKSQETQSKLPNSRRSQATEIIQENIPPPQVVYGVEVSPPHHLEARVLEKERISNDIPKKVSRSRLKPDREMSEVNREYAIGKGIPEFVLADKWNAFKNHHIAKGNLMADWDHAWRTWVDNASKFDKEHPGNSSNTGGSKYNQPTLFRSSSGGRDTDERHVETYLKTGIWGNDWGPKPGEPGCYLPPDLLIKARRRVA